MNQGIYFGWRTGAHRLCDLMRSFLIVTIGRTFGRLLDKCRTFQGLTLQWRDSGFEFGGKLVLPTAKRVCPGFHCIFIGRDLVQGAGAAPPVVLDEPHRRLMPS